MSTRTHIRNAYESQLNGAIGSGDASFPVDSAAGLLDPIYLCIDPENISLREYIRIDSISTNTFNGVTRGLAGSASGAQAHASGVLVRSVVAHQVIDEIFTDIESLETADTGHFGGTDIADHPEATPSVRGFLSSGDKTKLDAFDHGALAGLGDDDHNAGGNAYLTIARHTSEHGGGLGFGGIKAARGATVQNITPSGTVLVWNTLISEQDPGDDISYNLSTGEITFDNAGWFLITAYWAISGADSNTTVRRMILLGPGGSANNVQSSYPGGISAFGCTISGVIKAAAADTAEVQASYTGGSGESMEESNASVLTIVRIK